MYKVSLFSVLLPLAVSVQAQVPVDPGGVADTVKEEFGPVAWFVVVLSILAVGVFWYVLRASYMDRIQEKDAEIVRLRAEREKAEEEHRAYKQKKEDEDKKIEELLMELTAKLS